MRWGVAICAAAALTAVSAQAGRHVEMPRQPESGDIAAGRAIYAEACASCHGAALEGQPDWQQRNADGTLPAPPHDPSGHTWHHGDGVLFLYTRLGGQGFTEQRGITGFASGMPAFGDLLTDREIWDVLAYIKSTWPPKLQEAQQNRTALE